MHHAKATALAQAVAGSSQLLKPVGQVFAVAFARTDGRHVFLENDAGASYAEDGDCWGSLHDMGDKYLPEIDGYLWPAWGSEAWASGLATLLLGQAYRRGNGWTVAFQRLDGRFVVIGDRWAEVYRDRAAYERLVGETQRFEW